MGITVTPLGEYLGAEIDGVDLRHQLAADDVAEIEQAFVDYQVLRFRRQQLTAKPPKFGAARGGGAKAAPPWAHIHPQAPGAHPPPGAGHRKRSIMEAAGEKLAMFKAATQGNQTPTTGTWLHLGQDGYHLPSDSPIST